MCVTFQLSCTSDWVFFSLLLVQRKRTPLHHAAGAGYSEICQLLLEKGAHLDASDDVSAAFFWERHGMRCSIMSYFSSQILYNLIILSNSNMIDRINLTPALVLLPSTSSL